MGVAVDYQQLLFKLLPTGKAWPRNEDTQLARLLLAYAVELARVDERAQALLSEAYPYTTFELLSDWERLTGLPDGCAGTTDSLQLRRAAILEKLARRGGQSRKFFIDMAALFGFTITITEYRPFLAGRNRVGDRVYSEDWRYVWQVNGPAQTYQYFRAGQSVAGERLRGWGNELLECLINRLKPAHTLVRFAYEEIP